MNVEESIKELAERDPIKMAHKYNVFMMPGNIKLPNIVIPEAIKNVLRNNLKAFSGMREIEERYLNLMKKLSKTKMLPSQGHLELLKVLLFVEQYYMEEEVKLHFMSNQIPIPDLENNSFTINVPDLDEDNPFVTVGDFILLDKNILTITEIKNGSVKAKFYGSMDWYSETSTYDVSFKLHNYSMRCYHYAIENMVKCGTNEIFLHPKMKKCNKKMDHERTWFNINIEKNAEQKRAIEHIINKTAKPAPYILFGPPGTGKTSTIVEAIMQVHSSDPSNRVLICSPSNTAADEVTKKLLEHINASDILRLYSPSRDIKQVDKRILSCANFIDGNGLLLPKEVIITKSIVISTLTTCMRLLGLKLCNSYFSYVFIDEAGQATEPETLIPFALLGTDIKHQIHTQFVLAGDPLQLGPVIKSKFVGHLLGMSMMERLMTLEPYQKNENNEYNPNYITKLIKNFRSHDAILKIPNELFYNNELVACGGSEIALGEDWEHLMNKKFPVIFHAVSGPEYKEEGNLSTYNLSEIDAIFHYLKKLTVGTKKFDHKNIGVLTPFKLQEKRIKDRLRNCKISDVNVGTVQIFQGQEKDVIILSTVRSRLLQNDGGIHIGFLANTKRFNVSLTRAKSLLIVVGNPHVLKYDEAWKKFITYCVQNNACFGEKFSLQESINDCKNLIKPATYMPKGNLEILDVDNKKDKKNTKRKRKKNQIKLTKEQGSFPNINGTQKSTAKNCINSNAQIQNANTETFETLLTKFKNVLLDCRY